MVHMRHWLLPAAAARFVQPRPTGDQGVNPYQALESIWLDVDVRRDGARTVVEVGGEIDAYSAFRLKEALLALDEDGRHLVAVDMGAVEFMDSTGLGVLVGAVKRATAKGGGLCIVGACERVLKTLRITGLVRVIPAFETLDEALTWLDAR
jgi:anti-sigma B factor antagonist